MRLQINGNILDICLSEDVLFHRRIKYFNKFLLYNFSSSLFNLYLTLQSLSWPRTPSISVRDWSLSLASKILMQKQKPGERDEKKSMWSDPDYRSFFNRIASLPTYPQFRVGGRLIGGIDHVAFDCHFAEFPRNPINKKSIYSVTRAAPPNEIITSPGDKISITPTIP